MSTERTRHVLDTIDGALLDYTVSDDAMRWTPEPATPSATGLRLTGGRTYIALTPEQVGVAMRAFGESFQRSMADLGEALARFGEAVNRVRPQLEEAGLLETPPPSDPRERALQARQHRNTGPSRDVVHMRRPRRAVI